jgi:hypothetical protein
MMLYGLDAKSGNGMRLTGPWPANQHDVVSLVEELTTMELSQCGFVDLAGSEIESR